MAILELVRSDRAPISDEDLLLLLCGGWVLEDPDVRDPVQRRAMIQGAFTGVRIDAMVNSEPASERRLP
jgi:hypothetical protein